MTRGASVTTITLMDSILLSINDLLYFLSVVWTALFFYFFLRKEKSCWAKAQRLFFIFRQIGLTKAQQALIKKK